MPSSSDSRKNRTFYPPFPLIFIGTVKAYCSYGLQCNYTDPCDIQKVRNASLMTTKSRRTALASSFTVPTAKLHMNREDQHDATISCLLLTSVSTCFGHHLQRTKALLLHLICCSGSAGCGWQRLWGAVLQGVISMKVSVLLNRNLHNELILQHSAPQPLPPTSSRTRTTHQMQ